MAPQRRLAWVLAGLLPLVLALAWIALLNPFEPTRKLATLAGLVLALLLGSCSVTDLRWHRIPNWATYPAFLWAVALNVAFLVFVPAEAATVELDWTARLGAIGLGNCLFGGGVCFVLVAVIYHLEGARGAGDVKLAAALGALLGVERGLSALVYGYIIAAAVMLSWTIWTVGPVLILSGLARRIGNFFLPGWVDGPTDEQTKLLKRPVPLAVFYTLGTLPVLLEWELQW